MKKNSVVLIILVLLAAVGALLYVFVFKGESELPYDQYSPGDFFVTNVKDSNRLLKTAVVLELDSEDMQDELKEKNTLIRDTIIFILRDMGETEIMSPDAQEILRTRLKTALGEKLETEHIIGILFNDFVMQ